MKSDRYHRRQTDNKYERNTVMLQQFSYKSNTQGDTMKELPDEVLTTITGGSANQGAQQGAIGGAILGTGFGAIAGARVMNSPRLKASFGTRGIIGGATLGALELGAIGTAGGAGGGAIGGAILKDKPHN
jgi:hypothetical protein